jgi:hypothetical protein
MPIKRLDTLTFLILLASRAAFEVRYPLLANFPLIGSPALFILLLARLD